MTDIAKVGFEVDSSDITQADKGLDAFSATAGSTDASMVKMLKTMDRLLRSFETVASKTARGKNANDNYTRSAERMSTVMERVNRVTGVSKASAMEAGASFEILGGKMDEQRAKFLPLVDAQNRYEANIAEINRLHQIGAISADEYNHAIARQDGLLAISTDAIRRHNAALKDYTRNSGVARHNVGNLAAQFQDVGITAAMGMNPMMIALQQGTQISAILGPLGMAGSVKALGAALQSVFGSVAFLTIVIVALTAAVVQMIDWAKIAKGALNGLAGVIEIIAPYAVMAAAGLALLYAPTIIVGMAKTTLAVTTLTGRLLLLAAGFLAANPALAFVLGLTAAVVAANMFRDEITQIFGFDIVAAAKGGVNDIIGVFVGGYNGIEKTWSKLPDVIGDVVISAANNTIEGVESMIEKTAAVLNPLLRAVNKPIIVPKIDLPKIPNPFEGAAAELGANLKTEIQAALGEDYVGSIIGVIDNVSSAAAAKLRDLAKGIGSDDDKTTGKTPEEKFQDIVIRAEGNVRDTEAQTKGLEMTAHAAAFLKHQTDLLNKATEQGIPIDITRKQKIDSLAKSMADADEQLRKATFIKRMQDDMKAANADVELQTSLIGKVGQERERLRIVTELLNAAEAEDIKLKDDQIKKIEEFADAQSKLLSRQAAMESFNQQREQYLEEQSLLQLQLDSLGKSREEKVRLRVEQQMLNDELYRGIKLLPEEKKALIQAALATDKLTESLSTVEKAYEFARTTARSSFDDFTDGIREGASLWSAFGDAAIGALNRIADKLLDSVFDNFLGNLIGGATGGSGGGILGFLFNAKGNVFGQTGVKAFAKGDAFTNSVVSQPTMFEYGASQLGIMGEAGPEAIMPLKRGRDGSLGVQMYGSPSARSGGRGDTYIQQHNQFNGVTREETKQDIQDANAMLKSEIDNELPGKIDEHNFERKRWTRE